MIGYLVWLLFRLYNQRHVKPFVSNESFVLSLVEYFGFVGRSVWLHEASFRQMTFLSVGRGSIRGWRASKINLIEKTLANLSFMFGRRVHFLSQEGFMASYQFNSCLKSNRTKHRYICCLPSLPKGLSFLWPPVLQYSLYYRWTVNCCLRLKQTLERLEQTWHYVLVDTIKGQTLVLLKRSFP